MYTMNELKKMYKNKYFAIQKVESFMAFDTDKDVNRKHQKLWWKLTAQLEDIDKYAKFFYGKTLYCGARGGVHVKDI